MRIGGGKDFQGLRKVLHVALRLFEQLLALVEQGSVRGEPQSRAGGDEVVAAVAGGGHGQQGRLGARPQRQRDQHQGGAVRIGRGGGEPLGDGLLGQSVELRAGHGEWELAHAGPAGNHAPRALQLNEHDGARRLEQLGTGLGKARPELPGRSFEQATLFQPGNRLNGSGKRNGVIHLPKSAICSDTAARSTG